MKNRFSALQAEEEMGKALSPPELSNTGLPGLSGEQLE